MKKLFSIIAVLSICLTLSACGALDFLSDSAAYFLGGETDADEGSVSPSEEEYTGFSPIECDNIDAEIWADSPFGTVETADRFQYGVLDRDEQEIYMLIDAAARVCEISIDVTEYDITYDRAIDLVEIFMADNPQYFYLSKYIKATHFADEDKAIEIRLSYTDGEITDTFDNDGLSAQADRELIEAQIEEFSDVCREVISSIPKNADPVRRQKIIHDYIVSNTEYDKEAAGYTDGDTVVPRAYDAYGALCEGMAVCEGYSKSFQYLCYLAGINAAQVVGTGDGEGHMWNAVEIEGSWYHTDVTWDDPVGGTRIYYDYFNISWYEMSVDHVITDGLLAAPGP